MSFKYLDGLKSKEGIPLVEEIINKILESNADIKNLYLFSGIKNDTHYEKIFKIFLEI